MSAEDWELGPERQERRDRLTSMLSTLLQCYAINEVFYSLQGEGIRVGTANVFIRFAGCNLHCEQEAGARSPGGFACDTDFTVKKRMTAQEIVAEARALSPTCEWAILTGGEPGLQLDAKLIAALKGAGFKLAIETNGTVALPEGLDWITVSPKVPEQDIKQRVAHEVKYVCGYGQEIPKTEVVAAHCLISPAFTGAHVDQRTLDWCVELVKENPEWRLSVQLHKLWGVR